jgi:hypothetical protein
MHVWVGVRACGWVNVRVNVRVCVRDPFAGQVEEGDEEEDGDVPYAACQEPHVPRQSIRVVRICALSTQHSMAAARVGLCLHTSHPGRSMRDVWLCVCVCVCVCVCLGDRRVRLYTGAQTEWTLSSEREKERACVP